MLTLFLLGIYIYSITSYHFLFNDEQTYLHEAWLALRGLWPSIHPLTPLITAPLLMLPQIFWELSVKSLLTGLLVLAAWIISRRDSRRTLLILSSPVWILLAGHVMTEAVLALTLALVSLTYTGLISRSRYNCKHGFVLPTLFALASFAAYLAKYSALPFILPLMIYMLYRRIPRATYTVLVFAGLLLTYNVFISGFSSERWSLSFLKSPDHGGYLALNRLGEMLPGLIYKTAAGYALAFMPHALVLAANLLLEALKAKTARISQIFMVMKSRVVNVVEPELILAVSTYAITVTGYYVVLSISHGMPWSVDHIARYLVPLTLFITPRAMEKNRMLLSAAVITSGLVGLYLVHNASIHAFNKGYWSNLNFP